MTVATAREQRGTTKLRKLFEELEQRKETMLSHFADWSLDGMRARPHPTDWCALEVLDHVIKVERSSLIAVRKQLPDGHPVTIKDRLRAIMVISVMRSPMRGKVPPSATTVLPDGAADFPSLASKWAQTREQMKELLFSLKPDQCRGGLFQHPVSGWMTMAQTMAFHSAHIRHHEYQLKRLRGHGRS